MKIPIEISARHIHLNEQDLETLFGKEYKLTSIKPLSQTGEFAAEETVDLVNEENKLKARVLGPIRNYTQVEISLTDSRLLKLKEIPQIRVSGNIEGSPEILIKGKKGEIKAKVIIAKRHLHCPPDLAEELKLENKQKVKVKLVGERALVFDEIEVRINPSYTLTVHLDTDEANAAGLSSGKQVFGELIK